MAFSRVHYRAIAAVIRQSTVQLDMFSGELHTRSTRQTDTAALVDGLIDLFKADNTRFDEGRFIDACYPP